MLQRMIVIDKLFIYNPFYAGMQPWRPGGAIEFYDFYPIALTWESFTLTNSDYDTGDDLIECPCDAKIDRETPWTAGNLMRQIKQHLHEKHGIDDA